MSAGPPQCSIKFRMPFFPLLKGVVTETIRHRSVSSPDTADADIKTWKKTFLKTRSGNQRKMDVTATEIFTVCSKHGVVSWQIKHRIVDLRCAMPNVFLVSSECLLASFGASFACAIWPRNLRVISTYASLLCVCLCNISCTLRNICCVISVA